MRYAYVENGKIIEGPKSLPTAWRNISGLNNLSDADLKALGWLPWRFVETQGEVITGSVIDIRENEIVETQTRRNKTDEEIAAEMAQHSEQRARDRQAAYIAESDPVFFKWQRGEATQQQWLDKIAEIKMRYP
jgi:hypothetical protein